MLGVRQIPKISGMTKKPNLSSLTELHCFSNMVHMLKITHTAAQYEGDKYN